MNAVNSLDYDRIFSSNPPGLRQALSRMKILICGAGGLGSNVAFMLARAGVSALHVIDYDVVEHSNLNRQQYFFDQIGRLKTDALEENLLRINPLIRMIKFHERLDSGNCERLIPPGCDVIFECFDKAESKAVLADFCLRCRPDTPLICVSGTAGVGEWSDIKVRKGPGRLIIVGDGTTEANDVNGTLSSRVAQVAAIQAHIGIGIMLEKSRRPHP